MCCAVITVDRSLKRKKSKAVNEVERERERAVTCAEKKASWKKCVSKPPWMKLRVWKREAAERSDTGV